MGCYLVASNRIATRAKHSTMPDEPKRIGLREVRALGPGQIVWDAGKGAVAGFCARRQRGPAVTYYVKYRTLNNRQRWLVIGKHGTLTPEEARAKAKLILGSVIGGSDPAEEKRAARKAKTVTELCDLYLADAESGNLLTKSNVPKKASTLATDRGRIERHIKPLLGRTTAAAVTQEDIQRFIHAVTTGETASQVKTKKHGLARVRGGKGTASRTVGLLGAIFSYAVNNRICHHNPVRGVRRSADGQRKRRLGDSEYVTFAAGLREGELRGTWPPALAAARFLALTGWHSGEALALKWSDLDLTRRTARLPDTKTGQSIRPLSIAACEVLRQMLPLASELVFPASRGDGRMIGFPKFWARIAKFRALPSDVTPHVLRHSFASLAADLGYTELTIAALVGHKSGSITSRYVHSADVVLLAAADAVANRTLDLMGETKPEADVLPLRARQ